MTLRPIPIAGLLAGVALLLYTPGLGGEPLSADEAAFNAQATSIHSGAMPLFFHVEDNQWLQPLAVYANAGVRAAGGGALSGKIASAIAGAANVALLFLIAHLISGRLWVGATSAVILMLTPAHTGFARLGTDAIFPVPLILAWLFYMLLFAKRDSLLNLVAAAALLGLSVYSHPAAPLTAAFLWVYTLVVARRRNRLRLAIATAIFMAAWLPALAWFGFHFNTYHDTFGRWVILAAHVRSPLDLAQAFINPHTLGTRAALYWEFWDPSRIILGPPATALLLWWTTPLIALGVHRGVNKLEPATGALVIGTSLIVPLAGSAFGAPLHLASAAAIVPMAALISGLGADQIAFYLDPTSHRLPSDTEAAGRSAASWPS